MCLCSVVEISDEQVSELKTLCTNYFRANAIFFYVNPTVWTIGHVVLAHTEYMKGKYGLGLGLNSTRREGGQACVYFKVQSKHHVSFQMGTKISS